MLSVLWPLVYLPYELFYLNNAAFFAQSEENLSLNFKTVNRMSRVNPSQSVQLPQGEVITRPIARQPCPTLNRSLHAQYGNRQRYKTSYTDEQELNLSEIHGQRCLHKFFATAHWCSPVTLWPVRLFHNLCLYLHICLLRSLCPFVYRLVGLVVKASGSGAEDPGF